MNGIDPVSYHKQTITQNLFKGAHVSLETIRLLAEMEKSF
jgi:tryptophanase